MASEFTQYSETDIAHFCVMHQPSKEIFISSLHPLGSLYEKAGSSAESIRHHQGMVDKLVECGIQVNLVRSVLEKALRDPAHRRKLHLAAKHTLRYEVDFTATNEDLAQLESYKLEVIEAMDDSELVDALIMRPTVHLSRPDGRFVTSSVEFKPSGNLVFTRDQQIVTARGLILGSLHGPQRSHEVELMKFVWQSLGVPIIAEVPKTTILEGGDFVPAGDISYIGCGIRTNQEAINYLMKNDLFGSRYVAVVKDLFDRCQDRMHLDTFFNIVDNNTCVISSGVSGIDNPKRRLVDEYKRDDFGKYHLTRKDVEFSLYLTEQKMHVVPISEKQQLEYMANFLSVRHKHIIAVHPDLEKVLRDAGVTDVKVEYVPYGGITRMYGAAHCTTQIFRTRNISEVPVA
jgi:arginine deiminase